MKDRKEQFCTLHSYLEETGLVTEGVFASPLRTVRLYISVNVLQCALKLSLLICLILCGENLCLTSSAYFQNIKPVQPVAVGGVGSSQFKTIIPLPQPNVQQIQVPGSRFHYVRLVTATTASSTGQPSGPSTSSIQTGDL